MTSSNKLERKLYVPTEVRMMFDKETGRWELSMDNGGNGLERIGFISESIYHTKCNNFEEAITNTQSALFFFRHFARSFLPGDSLNTDLLMGKHDASLRAAQHYGEIEE